MKLVRIMAAIAALAVLAGCGSMATTPDEFRSLAKQSRFARTDNFTINKPYREVMGRIAKRAPQCLTGGVKTTSTVNNGYGPSTSVTYTYYKPTVAVGASRSEVHMQQLVKGTVLVAENKDKLPKDGWYIMVADIYPAGANTTKIDILRGFNLELIATAIRHWADGTSLGCPDLTKI